MTMGRWHRAFSALCVAAACAGCGSQGSGARDGIGSCQDVRMPAGDGGIFLAFGWDKGKHPFGQMEPLLVCVGPGIRVSMVADAGITVTPGELQVTGTPVRFQIMVQPGTTGTITYTQTLGGSVLHTGRFLAVTSSDDGWRFRDPSPPPARSRNPKLTKTTIPSG